MNQTRRVYQFQLTVPMSEYALRERTRDGLRRLLRRVWNEWGRGPAPALRFRRAETSQATFYPDGSFDITLVPSHECIYVLLHEIAHCLHPHESVEHGPRFMATYIKLLARYARMSEEKLLINAALYGIKVHGFTHR